MFVFLDSPAASHCFSILFFLPLCFPRFLSRLLASFPSLGVSLATRGFRIAENLHSTRCGENISPSEVQFVSFRPSCVRPLFLTVVRARTDPPYGIFMRQLGPRSGERTNWQAVVCVREPTKYRGQRSVRSSLNAVRSNTYVKKCISMFERVLFRFVNLVWIRLEALTQFRNSGVGVLLNKI